MSTRFSVPVLLVGIAIDIVPVTPLATRPGRSFTKRRTLNSYQGRPSALREFGHHQEIDGNGDACTHLYSTKKEGDAALVVGAGADIYSKPSLYDLAFGYRDFEAEVDFLTYAHEKYSPSREEPKRILELAAGPARHSLISLTGEGFDNYVHATAVDLSADMKDYAIDLVQNEYSHHAKENERSPLNIVDEVSNPSDESTFQYLLGDMRSIDESKAITVNSFDTAWILLGSLQHLNTNQDVIQCFKSINRCLSDDGTLVIELPHPQEAFSMVECTRNTWEVPLELSNDSSAKLKVLWGDETDKFNPVTQVRDFSVRFDLTSDGDKGGDDDSTNQSTSLSQIIPTRLFTAQEMHALAQCGGFEVAAMYGALDPDVSIMDFETELAYRMVCVLRKQQNRSEKEKEFVEQLDKSS
jgi:SAM-dependent methyltransferase